MKTFEVSDLKAAEATLEYFNAFHDGFIRRLSLHSYDEFLERGVQERSRRLELTALIAHYNYQGGEIPADRVIEARFESVMGLEMSISGLLSEWSIHRIEVTTDHRTLEYGPPEACLRAEIYHPHLTSEQEWEWVPVVTFTFQTAQFEEVA